MNIQILSKVFGLFPDSLLLLSDDRYVETANADGSFEDVDDLHTWSVSGESLIRALGPGQPTIPYSYQQQTARIAPKRGKGKGKWTPQPVSECVPSQSMMVELPSRTLDPGPVPCLNHQSGGRILKFVGGLVRRAGKSVKFANSYD